eukprot:762507-Hanusia_phi.AAC.1
MKEAISLQRREETPSGDAERRRYESHAMLGGDLLLCWRRQGRDANTGGIIVRSSQCARLFRFHGGGLEGAGGRDAVGSDRG